MKRAWNGLALLALAVAFAGCDAGNRASGPGSIGLTSERGKSDRACFADSPTGIKTQTGGIVFGREDELLVVQGRASLDEYSGNVRVSGEELFDFAQARSRFAKQLELRCNGVASVAQLAEIIKPWSEGECRILIQYSNGFASCQLNLGDKWRVTLADALINDLRAVLQPENVKVGYS